MSDGRVGRRPAGGQEQGSGTILVLGLVIVGGFLLTIGLGLAAAVLARHRASAAADLAALAAVDAWEGAGSASADSTTSTSAADAGGVNGPGCGAAEQIAAANGAQLERCRWLRDGSVLVAVRVRVDQTALGIDLNSEVSARAGPGRPS